MTLASGDFRSCCGSLSRQRIGPDRWRNAIGRAIPEGRRQMEKRAGASLAGPAEDHSGTTVPMATRTERLTFLIADIRGYSTFTRERGDAAAALLAQKFADLARDAVEARRGRVI